jgi:hypothetical protein
MGKCNKCERTWSAMSECHCSGCHKHFKSLGGFDKHRTGKGRDRRCLATHEMKELGMVFLKEKEIWVGSLNTDFKYQSKPSILPCA